MKMFFKTIGWAIRHPLYAASWWLRGAAWSAPILGVALLLLCPARAATQTPPCPTGKTCSGTVTFTVTLSPPGTPASVSPSSVVGGAPATTVTLTAGTGSSFNAQMIVEICAVTPAPCTTATELVTTFVSASSITAVVPASLLTGTTGSYAIYISQPANAHASLLNWNASSSTVAGYNVYRSGTSGGPLTDPTSSSTPRPLPA
jgi:hypothetical protein